MLNYIASWPLATMETIAVVGLLLSAAYSTFRMLSKLDSLDEKLGAVAAANDRRWADQSSQITELSKRIAAVEVRVGNAAMNEASLSHGMARLEALSASTNARMDSILMALTTGGAHK